MAKFPDPDVSVGCSQASPVDAIQLQPVGEIKLMEPEPAVLVTVALPGLTE